MKKALKLIGILFLILMGFLLLAVVTVFLRLPNPSEIGRLLARGLKEKSSIAKSVSGDFTASAVSADPVVSSPSSIEETPQSSAGNLSGKNPADLKALQNMMDPNKPKSQVCAHLISADLVPDSFRYDNQNFGEHIKTAILDEDPKQDPMMHAVVAPIRHFLQQPKLGALIHELTQASDEDRNSLAKKAAFYARVYGVYQEMKEQQPVVEKLMDRSYHLMMLARAVKKNPSLIADSQLQEFCQKTEASLNVGEALDWEAESTQFQELLQTLRVSPQEIGYDPNYRTHLRVEQNTGNVRFTGGWLEQVLPNKQNKN